MPTDGTDVKVRQWDFCVWWVLYYYFFIDNRKISVPYKLLGLYLKMVNACLTFICLSSFCTKVHLSLQYFIAADTGMHSYSFLLCRCTQWGQTMPMLRPASPQHWMVKWKGIVKAKKFVTQSSCPMRKNSLLGKSALLSNKPCVDLICSGVLAVFLFHHSVVYTSDCSIREEICLSWISKV